MTAARPSQLSREARQDPSYVVATALEHMLLVEGAAIDGDLVDAGYLVAGARDSPTAA